MFISCIYNNNYNNKIRRKIVEHVRGPLCNVYGDLSLCSNKSGPVIKGLREDDVSRFYGILIACKSFRQEEYFEAA